MRVHAAHLCMFVYCMTVYRALFSRHRAPSRPPMRSSFAGCDIVIVCRVCHKIQPQGNGRNSVSELALAGGNNIPRTPRRLPSLSVSPVPPRPRGALRVWDRGRLVTADALVTGAQRREERGNPGANDARSAECSLAAHISHKIPPRLARRGRHPRERREMRLEQISMWPKLAELARCAPSRSWFRRRAQVNRRPGSCRRSYVLPLATRRRRMTRTRLVIVPEVSGLSFVSPIGRLALGAPSPLRAIPSLSFALSSLAWSIARYSSRPCSVSTGVAAG